MKENSKIQNLSTREVSITRATSQTFGSLKFLWTLVLGAWCFSACFCAQAQTAGPYVVMPGIQTGASTPASLNSGLTFETSWMTNKITEWWSADIIPATNGQPITSWTGRNGNTLLGTGQFVSQVPGNGHPGMFFSASAGMSDVGFLSYSFTNSGLILFVYTFPPLSESIGGENVVLSGGDSGHATYLDFHAVIQNNGNGNPFSVSDSAFGNATHTATVAAGNDTHVILFSWSPTNAYVMDDGKSYESWPNGGMNESSVTPSDFAQNLYVGKMAAGWNLNGYVSEVLISSNFTPANVGDQMSYYFMRKYGLLKDQLILLGDSLPMGLLATWYGNWSSMLASNYPGWLVLNEATSGSTTLQDLTNLLLSASSATMPGRKVAVLWNALVNDRSSGLNVITNAQIAIAQELASNGIPCVLVLPPASFDGDTTLWGGQDQRYAYCNVMSNAWPQYFAAVANLAQDSLIGSSNAWTNLTYYASGFLGNDHLTNAGYAEGYPYLQAALNYVCNPAYLNFTGGTNQPPPWQGVGWSCEYQGHLYNSLGANSWTLIK